MTRRGASFLAGPVNPLGAQAGEGQEGLYPIEGPNAGAGEENEEEGVAETTHLF